MLLSDNMEQLLADGNCSSTGTASSIWFEPLVNIIKKSISTATSLVSATPMLGSGLIDQIAQILKVLGLADVSLSAESNFVELG